jgi:hypothetical protein
MESYEFELEQDLEVNRLKLKARKIWKTKIILVEKEEGKFVTFIAFINSSLNCLIVADSFKIVPSMISSMTQ